MRSGWPSKLPKEFSVHEELFFQPPGRVHPLSTQASQRGSEEDKEHMEIPPAGDRGNVMCSWVPGYTQVSTIGTYSYSLHTCPPGMLWFRWHASAPELTYLGCSMLATPARQLCRGGISGAIPAPGEIPRLVLLVRKVRTVPAWNATIARAGEGRKGLKRAKNSTRRADGGQEPGVAKAIWCRVEPGKHFCCCNHLWAQNVSFQLFNGVRRYSRKGDSLLASPLPSPLSPSLP